MIIKTCRYWKASSILIWTFQTKFMADPILYLSILLGLGGVYILISSFHDDDGEKYSYNLEETYLTR